MIVIFGIFLLTLLVITAIAIVRTRNLFVAVMLLGIYSLLIALNFFIIHPLLNLSRIISMYLQRNFNHVQMNGHFNQHAFGEKLL